MQAELTNAIVGALGTVLVALVGYLAQEDCWIFTGERYYRKIGEQAVSCRHCGQRH